jgi:hypothetical protein
VRLTDPISRVGENGATFRYHWTPLLVSVTRRMPSRRSRGAAAPSRPQQAIMLLRDGDGVLGTHRIGCGAPAQDDSCGY